MELSIMYGIHLTREVIICGEIESLNSHLKRGQTKKKHMWSIHLNFEIQYKDIATKKQWTLFEIHKVKEIATVHVREQMSSPITINSLIWMTIVPQ